MFTYCIGQHLAYLHACWGIAAIGRQRQNALHITMPKLQSCCKIVKQCPRYQQLGPKPIALPLF